MTQPRARMKNPAVILPDALNALFALSHATKKSGVPEETFFLVQLRASQINGCSLCLEMHAKEMKKAGATDERIFAVGAWREAPYYTDAERAALALTEALTRIADRDDPVPDALWEDVRRHYEEPALAALILSISVINTWNRLNVATRQIAGSLSR